MECMEVWGGNKPADRKLTTSGLDIWVYSKPYAASKSGGDVYYVSSCSSGRITRLLLADVSGHGQAVSERAILLRQLMRRHINHFTPSSLVEGINSDFEAHSKTGSFATAIIGTFFLPTSSLTLINAGHPNPLMFDGSNENWIPTSNGRKSKSVRNFPLGIDTDQKYSSTKSKLKRDDLVLCFTDGLLELNLADGSMLGESGLLKILSKLDLGDPGELLRQLLDQLKREQSEISSADDVSIMLFRRNDSRVSLRDNILAPFRALFHFFRKPESY